MRNKRSENPLSTVRLMSQEADRVPQKKKPIRSIQLDGLGTAYHRVAFGWWSIGQGSQTQRIRQPGRCGRPHFVRWPVGCRHGNAEKSERQVLPLCAALKRSRLL